MKVVTLGMALAVGLGIAGSASAGVYADDLGKCLAESSSPQDRAALVQWMFSGLSMNPAVKPMTDLTPQQRDTYNREAASVFERLLVRDCHSQAVKALKYEGNTAFQGGFEVLGRVAATTMMSEPAAAAELQRFISYMDMSKVTGLLAEAGVPTAPAAHK
jgi:hypothetical protein